MSSSDLILKVKTKLGNHKLDALTPNHTIQDLKRQLSNLSKIPINNLHVLSGFPPKVLDISNDNKKLNESGLVYGDTLILEEKVQSPNLEKTDESYRPHILENQTNVPGILMKKIVPADNSCLFSSVHFVLNGKVDESGEIAQYMRKIIAETISADTELYSEAILGKPNQEYCTWIQDNKSWGGAIEISILSKYYGIEIAVVNTLSGNISRFGEDLNFGHRVFLMFDGIHYDPLYMESLDANSIQTLFPTSDERILKEAEDLAHEAKSSRQFTDVNKFTLKCTVCGIYLSGQVQAQDHAKTTGHMNFGEV